MLLIVSNLYCLDIYNNNIGVGLNQNFSSTIRIRDHFNTVYDYSTDLELRYKMKLSKYQYLDFNLGFRNYDLKETVNEKFNLDSPSLNSITFKMGITVLPFNPNYNGLIMPIYIGGMYSFIGEDNSNSDFDNILNKHPFDIFLSLAPTYIIKLDRNFTLNVEVGYDIFLKHFYQSIYRVGIGGSYWLN